MMSEITRPERILYYLTPGRLVCPKHHTLRLFFVLFICLFVYFLFLEMMTVQIKELDSVREIYCFKKETRKDTHTKNKPKPRPKGAEKLTHAQNYREGKFNIKFGLETPSLARLALQLMWQNET